MPPRSVLPGLAALIALVAVGTSARADEGGSAGAPPGFVPRADQPAPLPAGFMEGVDVKEHLGERVPLDARFRDHTGRAVTLADAVPGDLPVLMTFNYSSCPQLCDLQLNGLVHAIAGSRLTPGKHFRIVTVVLAPEESPTRAGLTRDRYLAKLRAADVKVAEGGWTFLVSHDGKDEAAIRAVASAAGVGYRYVERQAEYAHPATTVVLAPSGVITRYVHGIEPVADDIDLSLAKAALSELSPSAGFILACFHWNPDGRAQLAAAVMRYGALGFAAIVIVIGVVLLRRRTRPLPGVTPS